MPEGLEDCAGWKFAQHVYHMCKFNALLMIGQHMMAIVMKYAELFMDGHGWLLSPIQQ